MCYCVIALFVEFVCKEGEVDLAVGAVLPEMGMRLEGVFGRMLEDEDAVVGEHSPIEDQVGQRCEFLNGVGRVGEDDVEAAVGTFQQVEDVGAHHVEVADAELRGALLDEVGALLVDEMIKLRYLLYLYLLSGNMSDITCF